MSQIPNKICKKIKNAIPYSQGSIKPLLLILIPRTIR